MFQRPKNMSLGGQFHKGFTLALRTQAFTFGIPKLLFIWQQIISALTKPKISVHTPKECFFNYQKDVLINAGIGV